MGTLDFYFIRVFQNFLERTRRLNNVQESEITINQLHLRYFFFLPIINLWTEKTANYPKVV